MGFKHRIVGGRGWESSQIQLAEIPRGSTLSPSPQEAHINSTGSQGPSVSIHYIKKKNESRALWNVKQAGGQAAMGQNQRHSPLLPPTGKQEATRTLRNPCACSPRTSRSGTHACGTFGLAEPTRACSTHPDMPTDTRCTIACGCQGPRCQLSTSHRPWTRIHRHALGTTTKPRPLARPTLFSSSRKTGGNATLPSSFHLALSKP